MIQKKLVYKSAQKNIMENLKIIQNN
jgi:hypothetical protein